MSGDRWNVILDENLYLDVFWQTYESTMLFYAKFMTFGKSSIFWTKTWFLEIIKFKMCILGVFSIKTCFTRFSTKKYDFYNFWTKHTIFEYFKLKMCFWVKNINFGFIKVKIRFLDIRKWNMVLRWFYGKTIVLGILKW